MNLLIETNAWQANDHGTCRNECSNRREAIDRNGLCEWCYNHCEAQLCCDSKCMNIRHVAGEDGCSLHELQWAVERQHAHRITVQPNALGYGWEAWRGDMDLDVRIGRGPSEAAAIVSLKDSEDDDIDVEDGAQIALWTAYHSLDETLTHPQLRRMV